MRAVAYYLYDWRLKDGSRVSFECADVFNFDLDTGRIASIVLVYDTHLVRDVVQDKYPCGPVRASLQPAEAGTASFHAAKALAHAPERLR